MKPYRARKKGARRGERKEYPFYPNHLLRILMMIMVSVAVITALAALFPLPLDRIADPLAITEAKSRTLWILNPAIVLGSLVHLRGLTAVIITLLAGMFVLLPILDRSGKQSIKRRLLVAVPFLIWMTFLALSIFLSPGPGQ
jgi:quinol-cytochrome oxidoreductase complex cytochrome b subunit